MGLRQSYGQNTIPADIRGFLKEAERRIERFQFQHRIPSFVASDYSRIYATLQDVLGRDLAMGDRFCEWGSGFGVVACLAAKLGFDSYGFEIEPALVDAAREIAADFDINVEFVEGSYFPLESPDFLVSDVAFAWLDTQRMPVDDSQDLAPTDFDVIFAYPWPDEEASVGTLFERHANVGALLMTYHADGDVRLRRRQ